MPKVLSYVEELVIGPTDDEPRVWIGHAGDEVPDWALVIASSPRAIDFESEVAGSLTTFPANFPGSF